MREPSINACATNELLAYLDNLRADIAVTIPWDVLHRWTGASSLAVEHYSQLQSLWNEVWRDTRACRHYTADYTPAKAEPTPSAKF
jgi:hypothetical protein